MPEPQTILLTGERQVGKSTLCLRLMQLVRETGLDVSGLITRRTGPHDLAVLEIATGKFYSLTLPFEGSGGIKLPHFRMDPTAMARSMRALESSFPTQVLILDELGPLELLRGKGWVNVLRLLGGGKYWMAFIVVRPALIINAVMQLPTTTYTVVRVTLENRDFLPDALLKAAERVCLEEPHSHVSFDPETWAG